MANSTLKYVPGPHAGNSRMVAHLVNGQVPQSFAPAFTWGQLITYSDFSAAATSKTITINTTFSNNKFPADVEIVNAYVKVITLFAGGAVSAASLIAGDAANDNGLVTATDVFTGAGVGYKHTAAAAELSSGTPEAAFEPTIKLTTTSANTSALTAGALIYYVVYRPIPLIKES